MALESRSLQAQVAVVEEALGALEAAEVLPEAEAPPSEAPHEVGEALEAPQEEEAVLVEALLEAEVVALVAAALVVEEEAEAVGTRMYCMLLGAWLCMNEASREYPRERKNGSAPLALSTLPVYHAMSAAWPKECHSLAPAVLLSKKCFCQIDAFACLNAWMPECADRLSA